MAHISIGKRKQNFSANNIAVSETHGCSEEKLLCCTDVRSEIVGNRKIVSKLKPPLHETVYVCVCVYVCERVCVRVYALYIGVACTFTSKDSVAMSKLTLV